MWVVACFIFHVVFLSSCFDPTLGDRPFLCGATDPICPTGYHCAGGVCTTGGGGGADAGPKADARVIDGGGGSVDARPGPDAAFECDPGKPKSCDGDDVLTCSADGKITNREACAALCVADPAAHCGILEPTNLPRDVCDAPALKPRRITADVTIDTDACTDGRKIPQSGAPAICLLEYTDLVVEVGVVVSATGQSPLAFQADTMNIGGVIDVSGIDDKSGPGAVLSGIGNTTDGRYANGGSGGGYANAGGKGGTEEVLITVGGGSSYGNAELHPLVGGSPGGRAGAQPSICTVNCPVVARGGGGGGALQLVACKQLVLGVVGNLEAGGAGGLGGFAALMGGGGGGGGGSGGAILLEAPRITVGAAAFLYATGGGGGGGGGMAAGEQGGHGIDGQPDGPAPGGGRGSVFAGRGGSGGTRDAAAVTGVLPGDGETIQKVGYGAGAGGGGAGRIRINSRASEPVDPRTFIVLPYPSLGVARGH